MLTAESVRKHYKSIEYANIETSSDLKRKLVTFYRNCCSANATALEFNITPERVMEIFNEHKEKAAEYSRLSKEKLRARDKKIMASYNRFLGQGNKTPIMAVYKSGDFPDLTYYTIRGVIKRRSKCA